MIHQNNHNFSFNIPASADAWFSPEPEKTRFKTPVFDSAADVFDNFFGSVESPVSTPNGGGLDNRGATFPLSSSSTLPYVSKTLDLPSTDLRKSTAARWKLKHEVVGILRKHPKENDGNYAVCGCGYAATFKNDAGELDTVKQIDIYRRDDKVSVSGTLRCNSPWLCPSCAPARAEVRRKNIFEVIDRTNAKGGFTAFVTLTVRHKKNQSLEGLKAVLSNASRKARQGRAWEKIKQKGGVLGVVQGVEVLHNINTGWHYHCHLAVPCISSKRDAFEAMSDFVSRYLMMVEKEGGEALKQGQDIQLVDDSDDEKVSHYISKGSASWEIAGSLKDARDRKSRTPWDLARLAYSGDVDAERLFVEYAQVIVGTRSCVISPSLAKALHMTVIDSDGGEMDFDELEPVVSVISDKWRKMMNYSMAWQVINAVEQGYTSLQCEGIISDILDLIDEKEYQKACSENNARIKDNTKYLSIDEFVKYVKDYRAYGDSVSRAKSKAISAIRTRYRKMKMTVVLPTERKINHALLSMH